jgi:hypothetical protein
MKKFMNKRCFLVGLLVFAACFFLVENGIAQVTLVTFTGTVTDEEGGELPGATVNLRNVDTGYTYSSMTRSDGTFIISGIEAGQYEAQVSLTGFTTAIRRGMTFNVGARVSLDFQLSTAAVEESVTVTAEAPIVEVTKSEISSVVGRDEIDDLPVISRQFSHLAALKAGVAGGGDDLRGGAQPTGSSEVLVDGVSNEFAWYNLQRSDLPADAIQEFRVLVNQFGAEYGNATAIVMAAITRSGTNDFKGRAYGFYRDEAFDSVNYFVNHDEYQGSKLDKDEYEKENFSQFRYGGFLGGPIMKDKLHFFLSYEGARHKTYSVITSPLVPRETVEVLSKNDQFLAKLNFQLNEKNMFSFRYTRDWPRGENLGVGGYNTKEVSYDENQYDDVFQLNWTFYPTDNSMNEVRTQYSNRYFETIGNEMSGSPDDYQIRRPSGSFGKYWGNPMWWPEKRYQINDNFSLFHSSHNLKAGFDFNYVNSKVTSYWGHPGIFYFDTDNPFNPADSATYPYRFTWNAKAPSTEWYRMTSIAFYIQDTWKVTPQLTLNIGLRHSNYRFAQNPNQERFVTQNKFNWDPRIAFSYDPIGDAKTVIRGGVGRYTNSPMGNVIYASVVSRVEYEVRNIENPGYPDPFAANPFFPGGEVFAPPELLTFTSGPSPYAMQYTLGAQREVIPDLSVSADFVLTKGYHLYWFVQKNGVIPGTSTVRPDPTISDWFDVQNGGRSDYKGLYLQLKKRYSNGWYLEVSYTLSEAKADVESGHWNTPSNNVDRSLDYGPTNQDARHRLSISGIVDLPMGFQLSSIFYYRSALPYTITTGEDTNKDGIWRDYPQGEHRNSGRGFDYLTIDARISKFFNFGTRYSLQVFIEMFNLANRANFGSPTGNMQSSNFGIPRSASDPRLIQLGFRLNF